MRKLIVCNIMSLDGYVAGPGGNVMAMPMDSFFDEYNLERLRAADTLLLGTGTYTGLKSFWPAVADDPTVSPAVAANPEAADVARETGQRNNQIQKVVVSDSLTADDTAPWTDTTIIVRRADAHQAIAGLKSQPGGDILVFGSITLWNDLLTAGLGRRAPPDARRHRPGRRHPCLRHPAPTPPPVRHPPPAPVREPPPPLRGGESLTPVRSPRLARRRLASLISASSSRVLASPRATAASASSRRSRLVWSSSSARVSSSDS
jgi:dihydrofolate reductase